MAQCGHRLLDLSLNWKACTQPLLLAIANYPDRIVREEAAETLDLYLDQAGAREALEFAAEYDADSGVRQQAQTSLNGPERSF
jgi:hypothetical protein